MSDFDIFFDGSLSDMIRFAGAKKHVSCHVVTDWCWRHTKHSFWFNKNFSIHSIKAHSTISSKFEMLTLVLTHWDVCRSFKQSVRLKAFREKLHTGEREYQQLVKQGMRIGPVAMAYQKALHCLRVIIYFSIVSCVTDTRQKPYNSVST